MIGDHLIEERKVLIPAIPVYTVQYNRQFLKYRHFKYIIH